MNIKSTNLADGFGPVSLTRFAANPSSSHIFRVQHELLSRMMESIVFESYGNGTREELAERALETANSLTALRSMVETHQVLESGLMHKVLASDPRQRLAAEQFEREATSAVTALDKLLMTFGSPSQILAQMPDFSERAGEVFSRFKERFKAEERDLFPVFDRMTAGAEASYDQDARPLVHLASPEAGFDPQEGPAAAAADAAPLANDLQASFEESANDDSTDRASDFTPVSGDITDSVPAETPLDEPALDDSAPTISAPHPSPVSLSNDRVGEIIEPTKAPEALLSQVFQGASGSSANDFPELQLVEVNSGKEPAIEKAEAADAQNEPSGDIAGLRLVGEN